MLVQTVLHIDCLTTVRGGGVHPSWSSAAALEGPVDDTAYDDVSDLLTEAEPSTPSEIYVQCMSDDHNNIIIM